MKKPPEAGMEHSFRFTVPETKLVPALYPESAEFRQMPPVLATGYFVGLLEWACIQAINPHLDWPAQRTVGTRIDASRCAATPVGFEVTARVKLVGVEGRKLVFEVEAHDGVELVGKGRHERFVIDRARFDEKLDQKARGG